MGTISEWLGWPRFGSEFLRYLLKGATPPAGPPAKLRVHNVPWAVAVASVSEAVRALGKEPSALKLSLAFVGILLLLWPGRPHTVVSV